MRSPMSFGSTHIAHDPGALGAYVTETQAVRGATDKASLHLVFDRFENEHFAV